jgi:hypothetical protein
MLLTEHDPDSPARPRPQLRAPCYGFTRSRSETPSARLAPSCSHAVGFQAIDAAPSIQFRRRAEARHRDSRAFARRPSDTRRLWDGSVCALHRFTRARRTATVRGVSVKLLRARPRGIGLPYGFRAPRPRCTQPASTHPSFRPREPVTSCVPGFVTTLAGAASAASLARPFSPLRAWRHRRPSHGAEASLPRGTMRRAPGGLDLPMRETREKRVSRHAHRFGQPP